MVADQFAGDGSPVVGGRISVAGGDGSSAAGGAGSSVVGGGTSAASRGVVDGSSAAGDGASVGGDASGAGGGGDGVSPVLVALGADGSRDGSRAWSGELCAVGEDSSGVVSWAELPSSSSTVPDRSLFSSRFGSCSSPSPSSFEVVELRLAGGLGRSISALLFSS